MNCFTFIKISTSVSGNILTEPAQTIATYFVLYKKVSFQNSLADSKLLSIKFLVSCVLKRILRKFDQSKSVLFRSLSQFLVLFIYFKSELFYLIIHIVIYWLISFKNSLKTKKLIYQSSFNKSAHKFELHICILQGFLYQISLISNCSRACSWWIKGKIRHNYINKWE